MPTVAIESADYDALADVATADEYLAADFGATAWRAETDDNQKGRALVTATRLLNTALCVDGSPLPEVDEDEIPQEIIDGSIVLAKLIHSGAMVASSSTTSTNNIKRQRAGSVEQEFFSPILFADTGRWPTELLDLIGGYFCGSGLVGGSIAFGVDQCSGFIPDYSVSGP